MKILDSGHCKMHPKHPKEKSHRNPNRFRACRPKSKQRIYHKKLQNFKSEYLKTMYKSTHCDINGKDLC